MKNFIFAVCLLLFISCLKDDTNTVTGPSVTESNLVIKKISPLHENSGSIKDYRFDENNRVLFMFHETDAETPWYTYNYSANATLVSIDYSWGFIQIDQVNYKGRLDIELLDETMFRGNLNIYDENDQFVATLEKHELDFDGQLIKRVFRHVLDNDYQMTQIFEHDSEGRLLKTKDIINDNPIRDNWTFTAWTEEQTPLFNALAYSLDFSWFPDKFISYYGVTQGAFRDDETSSFSYEFESGTDNVYTVDWTGPYPAKRYEVVYNDL